MSECTVVTFVLILEKRLILTFLITDEHTLHNEYNIDNLNLL